MGLRIAASTLLAGRRLAARAVVVGTLAVLCMAGRGLPLGGVQAAPIMPVTVAGYTITPLIQGTAAYSSPDPIVVVNQSIYVAYQNTTQPDGSTGGSSTIVQYAMDGTPTGQTFSVKGHCDGLRYDPYTKLLWATVNEDANAMLYTVDPSSGTITSYPFSAATHGGGYDDLAFTNGMAFVAASNPTLNNAGVNTGPAVVKVTLQHGVAQVTPVLLGNALAYDTTTNKPMTLNVIDPDSMAVDPQGDVVLISQAGSDLTFIHQPGTAQQVVTHVAAGTQLEDTQWATASAGRLLVVDATANAVYTLSGNVRPGTVYTEAPSDSGVTNWVGTIDLSTGAISPIAIGFGSATGLLFVPDQGAATVTPAVTAANSSPPPTGAAAWWSCRRRRAAR